MNDSDTSVLHGEESERSCHKCEWLVNERDVGHCKSAKGVLARISVKLKIVVSQSA
jgi:hypothetical protein